MTESLGRLQTEGRNAKTVDIDNVSTLEMCRMINEEDDGVATAVQACLPEIAQAIDLSVPRVRDGGRVIYIGAGTSGRLGVLDASEIHPTFSAPSSQFVGLIAGGDTALRLPVEGAEDSEQSAVEDLSSLAVPISQQDVLLGLASSGRTPYVLGGLKYARSCGALTVGIACVRPSALRGLCDVLIECVTGPEVITGSTRMKAGTATKMILNMISTGTQIRIGRTFGNLMIDLKLSNVKLRERARRVFRTVIPASPFYDVDNDDVLDQLFAQCDNNVKLAILVAKLGCSPQEGRERLQQHLGVLRNALKTSQDAELVQA